jgi:hypothetical protein
MQERKNKMNNICDVRYKYCGKLFLMLIGLL